MHGQSPVGFGSRRFLLKSNDQADAWSALGVAIVDHERDLISPVRRSLDPRVREVGNVE
jgi:hypothetical protein